MAGKCKEMNKIKQVLRLHLDGESSRSIGRKLDLYKGTVNKYITLAESCGVTIPVLLAVEGRRSLNIDTNALQVISPAPPSAEKTTVQPYPIGL